MKKIKISDIKLTKDAESVERQLSKEELGKTLGGYDAYVYGDFYTGPIWYC